MSQQPPGAGQEGEPGFSQPQDPWSGFEPGLASMPTDPIPHANNPYPLELWSNPTVVHGAPPPQFPYSQPPKRNTAGVISIVVVLVLVLGGGGAYAAYRYITAHQSNSAGTGPPTPSTNPTSAPPTFPYTARTGDCVVNVGTEAKPKMGPSPCSAPASYTIVKIARGADIPVGPNGTFDTDTTSARVCNGVDFDTWYGYQVDDPSLNLFFCMVTN